MFFIVNGYRRYVGLIAANQLIILFAQLLVGSFVLFALTNHLFRNSRKAAIFTSCTLLFVLFFGPLQDFFSGITVLSILSPTRVLIIFGIVLLWFFGRRLKRSAYQFNQISAYFNSLLCIVIALEIFMLANMRIAAHDGTTNGQLRIKNAACDSCRLPSVYLVIMDEYLGSEGLKQHFKYDNNQFHTDLEARGFKVLNSPVSNYQLTLFSMASLLSMDYIEGLKESELHHHHTYKSILSLLKNNRVCRIFRASGYRIINHSNFEILDAAGLNSEPDLPQRAGLITSQTLFYQVRKYFPFWLQDIGVSAFRSKRQLASSQINEEIMQRSLRSAAVDDQSPQFVYTHLMMPHVPYVYDSTGQVTSTNPNDPSSFRETEEAYLQYLVYTNKRVSKFIADLQGATNGKAIILLMGDHGFRESVQNLTLRHQTFNAVFIPGGDYHLWHDGMSHVNQFRVLFNSVFETSLPLLEDSIVREEKEIRVQ